MILGEIRKHARLDPCSLNDASVSMNQHYGFTSALVYITNANPVRVEKFVFCGRHSRQQTDQEKQKASQEQTHTFPLSSSPNGNVGSLTYSVLSPKPGGIQAPKYSGKRNGGIKRVGLNRGAAPTLRLCGL